MSNPNRTHRQQIARRLSATVGVSYQRALHIVDLGADAGILPFPLDDAGVAKAVEILQAWSPPAEEADPHIKFGALEFPLNALKMHGLVSGMTGSGKTTLASHIAHTALQAGWSVTVLDQYGTDSEPWEKLAAHAGLHQHAGGTGGAGFAPLAGLTAERAAHVMRHAVHFDDQYWQNVNRSIFADLLAATDPQTYALGMLVAGLQAVESGPVSDRSKAAVGLGAKLKAILAAEETKFLDRAPLVALNQPGCARITIPEYNHGEYLVLAGVFEQLLAASVPKFHRLVVIDVNTEIDGALLSHFLGRARSQGIAVLLVAQMPKPALMQNINVALLLTQRSRGISEALEDDIDVEASVIRQLPPYHVLGRVAFPTQIQATGTFGR